MKMILSLFAVLGVFGMSNFAFAGEEKGIHPTETSSTPLYEIGATVGTPAGINLVLGYWSNNESFPWLFRASGMSFGYQLEGIQGDFGWAFSREGTFKQYLAISYAIARIGDDDIRNSVFHFTGGGPTYGFHWHGLAFQSGFIFGPSNKTYNSDGSSVSYPVQFVGELGYTFLF